MKRLMTKQMRDSFKVSALHRMEWWIRANCGLSESDLVDGSSATEYFQSTEKKRILILRRTIK